MIAAIASPLGVRTSIPLLVLAVGLLATFLGLRALRAASGAMADEALSEQAANVAHDLAFALDEAGPLLDRLATIGRLDGSATPFAHSAPELFDTILSHPGITYVSISYPDGTFRGAYREGPRIELQESRVEREGKDGTAVVRFTLDGTTLRTIKEERSAYDPRTRGFYTLALAQKKRVWTPPYTFYLTHYTGITCAEPVFDEAGALRAVITVDFDVTASPTSSGRLPTTPHAPSSSIAKGRSSRTRCPGESGRRRRSRTGRCAHPI